MNMPYKLEIAIALGRFKILFFSEFFAYILLVIKIWGPSFSHPIKKFFYISEQQRSLSFSLSFLLSAPRKWQQLCQSPYMSFASQNIQIPLLWCNLCICSTFICSCSMVRNWHGSKCCVLFFSPKEILCFLSG